MTSLESEFTLPLWVYLCWALATLLLLVAWVVSYSAARVRQRELLLQNQNKISMDGRLREEQERANGLQMELLELRVRSQEREKSWQAEMATLQSARDSLSKEFEVIANRLFDQKQEHFARSAKSQLENLILPFRDQMQEFRSRVDEAQRLDIAQHHQLIGQIAELQKQSHKIGQDAVNLANALKGNNKVLGNWGELILTRILEQMGFQEGREYALQVSQLDAEGRRLQPDAVIYLPNERDVIIDAKVSLLAYERYAAAESETEKNQALKDHVDSLRAHVRNLSGKNYTDLVQRRAVDFVCLFVPVEPAFVTAVQQAPELLQEAYDKKVVLVGPSSLFVVLKSISTLWQRERQDRNVERIVESAGKLYDQFARFLESMIEVGAGLDKANKSYEVAMNRLHKGNGNLMKRAEDLRRLGAKTNKNLPKNLLDQQPADSQDDEETLHD